MENIKKKLAFVTIESELLKRNIMEPLLTPNFPFVVVDDVAVDVMTVLLLLASHVAYAVHVNAAAAVVYI